MNLCHILRPDQVPEPVFVPADVVFMICGAFCTFGPEGDAQPSGFDFVFPPGPWRDPPTCALCVAIASEKRTASRMTSSILG